MMTILERGSRSQESIRLAKQKVAPGRHGQRWLRRLSSHRSGRFRLLASGLGAETLGGLPAITVGAKGTTRGDMVGGVCKKRVSCWSNRGKARDKNNIDDVVHIKKTTRPRVQSHRRKVNTEFTSHCILPLRADGSGCSSTIFQQPSQTLDYPMNMEIFKY